MYVDESKYVDQKETPEFILGLSEEGLFMRLGLVIFEIEQYGFYDPNKILKADWSDKGREAFRKYASIVKSKICKYYNGMKESGVLDTTEKVYLFLLGLSSYSKLNMILIYFVLFFPLDFFSSQ